MSSSRAPAMRFGLVLSILVALLVMLGLSVPVPGDFPVLPGGALPRLGTAPRCLALTYEPANATTEYLPRTMRLLAIAAPEHSARQPSYRAVGGPDDGLHRLAGWRPAGPDSIDIGWHHSPVLRLPTQGDSLVGRGGWAQYPDLFSALVVHWQFVVRAREIPCSS